MLAGFFSWWLARILELLPSAWTNAASRPRDALVVEAGPDHNITASIRRNGQLSPVSLGAAVRQAGRRPVLVRAPPGAVLIKHHTIPNAPRRQLGQVLRHELARITPFPADDLFWRWDDHARTGPGTAANRARTDVTLTMVPRLALAPALSALDNVGLRADFVEVGPTDRPRLLAAADSADRTTGTNLRRGLAGTCAALAVVAVMLPLGLQAIALHRTETAIAELQPAIAQVDKLRRGLAAGDAGRDVLVRQMARTGDVLQILATVTRILPDDTYLTDFSLRDRQMTISGRSASAPRLITAMSADPAIRDTAFAAPVTRIMGANSDIFSIKAEIAK